VTEHPQRRRALTLLVVLIAVVGALGYAASRPAPVDERQEAPPEAAAHIHGLGIDPADGALLIATHGGLFRAAPDERRAVRVGQGRQDTMGFTVIGPKRFLGSGHPDLGDDLPPLLGLIRSADAGRSWEPVSLLGEADFHVLRFAGGRIYGVNASDGTLLVSDDGGRTWQDRRPPGPLIDLAPHPARPDTLVAVGETRLYISRDGGRSWRPQAKQPVGLLAWSRGDGLYAVDLAGRVHRSSDAGRSWQPVGDIGGRPAAFAGHGDDLYVALHDNRVKTSSDNGRSWRLRAEL
jgi:hypothetical protein